VDASIRAKKKLINTNGRLKRLRTPHVLLIVNRVPRLSPCNTSPDYSQVRTAGNVTGFHYSTRDHTQLHFSRFILLLQARFGHVRGVAEK